MNKVTLIGLGAMGSAIANLLLKNNYDLTVWNRSVEKMERPEFTGAKTTQTIEEAIAPSQIIIVCIHGYEATRSLLDQPEILSLIKGKTIIQMSTGTPTDARNAEKWIHTHGGNYLDASIMVYPTTLGSNEAQILVSGSTAVYENCAAIFPCLGGDVRYLGERIGAAAGLDLAILSRLTVITAGVVTGAQICEAEGVSMQDFAEMYPEGDRARSVAMAIHNNEYENNVSASVGTAIECNSTISNHLQELGLNHEVPDFILSLYQRAVKAGYADHDAACLYKIMRTK